MHQASFFYWLNRKLKTQPHLLSLGLFFLGGFHYLETNAGGTGLELPYNMVGWIIISITIGIGLLRIAGKGEIVYSNLTLFLLASLCLLSIPTFYPGSNLVNESGIHIGLLGSFLFFISLQQFRPDISEMYLILFLVLCAGIVEALIGWKNYLGIDLMAFSVEGPGSEVPYGAIRQRNALSSLFVTAIAISGYLLVKEYFLQFKDIHGKLIFTALLVVPVVLIPLIVLLKSRTGWIGLAVVLTIFVISLLQTRARKYLTLWTLSIIVGFTIIPILESTTGGTEVVNAPKLNLAGPRTYMYEQIIDMALENPIGGYGYGNFESAYNEFAATKYASGEYADPAYENLSHPHNELLYWWVEGGILGLAGVLLAISILLKNIWKIPGIRDKAMLLALFFPIFFHSQTEIPFLSSIGHWIILIVFMLLVDAYTEVYKKQEVQYFLLPGALGVLIPVLTSLFMITTLQSGRLLNSIEYDINYELSALEDISNPVVWQDRLMWDMNFGLLALGVYQGRPELAVNYIQWAPQIIQRKPRAGYYQYLIVAYELVGDADNRDKTLKEAKFRFPDRDFDVDLSVFENLDNTYIPEIRANIVED